MVNELKELIGVVGKIKADPGIMVDIKIIDARVCWGKTQVLVQPVAGSGEAWKDLANVYKASGEPMIAFN